MSQYDKDKPPFDVPAQSQQPGAGRAILEVLARIEAKLDRVLAGGGGQAPALGVASDADLDGQYGDEEVKKDPPRWIKNGGDAVAPIRMSECTPAYLDEVASFCDWKAAKEDEASAEAARVGKTATGDALATALKTESDKKKYAGYSRKSAARARGWAARLRARPPETPTDPNW